MPGMGGEIPFSEQAAICLICACENQENRAARLLLARAGATSATGVVAAIYIASAGERRELIDLAEDAIREQRSACLDKGLFMADGCLDTGKLKANGTAAA